MALGHGKCQAFLFEDQFLGIVFKKNGFDVLVNAHDLQHVIQKSIITERARKMESRVQGNAFFVKPGKRTADTGRFFQQKHLAAIHSEQDGQGQATEK